MFCAHDPGLALFLAENGDDLPKPGLLEWGAFGGTLCMAMLALLIPS